MAELAGLTSPRMDWSSTDLPQAFKKFRATCELYFSGPLKEKSEPLETNPKVQSKLLEHDNSLTLDKAFDIARTAEATQAQLADIRAEHPVTAVNAMKQSSTHKKTKTQSHSTACGNCGTKHDMSARSLCPAYNCELAVINGPEKYETIAESLKDVLEEIDAVQDDGYVELDGKKINVEFFLGGDYKLLLQTMGLRAANSTYACLWCKVHKKDRGDMSKDDEYYEKDPLRRTLQDIIECGKRKRITAV
ncbi:predicted protein [Nematostella vectensis]|uniref:Uncharacterized protein n=1 Tax=Nematostella vectensis TaxID=45351 RepID=A7T3H4_NEMVE|nr:predicted protein [Nematostella vectensis]|eukprot:XP_001621591.1 hypothetical protein NEMVEDRAFT_v1g221803 [Nematostella vectensis]